MKNQSEKTKTIKETLLEQGYILGTHEYKKAYNRENWNRRTPESKRNSWKKGRVAKDLKLKSDPALMEKERQRWRETKKNQRIKRGEEINAKQRERYKIRGSSQRENIYKNRRKRDPVRGLASIIKDVRNGKRNPRELLDHTSSAIEQCRTLISRGKRKELSK